MKIKNIIGTFLFLGAIIGILVCAGFAIVFHIQNPDMTELRRFIEYPWPSIGAIICIIAMYVGKYLLEG